MALRKSSWGQFFSKQLQICPGTLGRLYDVLRTIENPHFWHEIAVTFLYSMYFSLLGELRQDNETGEEPIIDIMSCGGKV